MGLKLPDYAGSGHDCGVVEYLQAGAGQDHGMPICRMGILQYSSFMATVEMRLKSIRHLGVPYSLCNGLGIENCPIRPVVDRVPNNHVRATFHVKSCQM